MRQHHHLGSSPESLADQRADDHNRCPHCGWPATEAAIADGTAHRSADGAVTYRRCVCGRWLILLGDRILAAAAGSTRSQAASNPAEKSAHFG